MFTFYFGTGLMAILIGLFFVNLFSPGVGITLSPSMQNTEIAALKDSVGTHGAGSFVQVLLSIVPSNIVAAFASGQMLGLIFFSILFGYSLSKIESNASSTLQNFFKGIFETMIHITHIIMKTLPIGVFCLVSQVFMKTGIQSIGSVAVFLVTVLCGLATFMFIGLPLLLKFIAKVNPVRHLKAMTPALVTAFSTSSSSASLPITIDCVEKRSGVSNRICSLVVPLGTSINMAGSASL